MPDEWARPDRPGSSWLLIGGGGHALSVAAALRRAGGVVTGVVDPAPRRRWTCPVYISEAAAVDDGVTRAVMAIGANAARLQALRHSLDAGLTVGVLVAATATVDAVVIGAGSVVLEHGHVGPGTSLGDAVIVNTGAVVEHDCLVEDGVHVAPGACVLGGCVVEAGAEVGSRAVILPGRRVGSGARVGAGAVVTQDVPPRVTVIGVPAARRP